jgi:Family of unknown function (DUF5362)
MTEGDMADDSPEAGDSGNGDVVVMLRRTQPWVKFLGILGLILCGIMIVTGLGVGGVGLVTGNLEAAVLFIIYPLLAVLYLFPSMSLLRYSKRIRRFVRTSENTDLVLALDAQRSFWKFMGIMTVVSIVVGILGGIAAVFISLAAGLLRSQS